MQLAGKTIELSAIPVDRPLHDLGRDDSPIAASQRTLRFSQGAVNQPRRFHRLDRQMEQRRAARLLDSPIGELLLSATGLGGILMAERGIRVGDCGAFRRIDSAAHRELRFQLVKRRRVRRRYDPQDRRTGHGVVSLSSRVTRGIATGCLPAWLCGRTVTPPSWNYYRPRAQAKWRRFGPWKSGGRPYPRAFVVRG